MPLVATWSPADAALDILVPLGLAVAAGTCVVIDLEPMGPVVGSGPSLADLAADGPERRDLEPRGPGVAYLANGGIDPVEADGVIRGIADRWPAVVLRCDPRAPRPTGAIALATLLPEPYLRIHHPPAAYQRCGFSPQRAPEGVVLPTIRRGTVDALLAGRLPRRSDRWIRSLRPLWGTGA